LCGLLADFKLPSTCPVQLQTREWKVVLGVKFKFGRNVPYDM